MTDEKMNKFGSEGEGTLKHREQSQIPELLKLLDHPYVEERLLHLKRSPKSYRTFIEKQISQLFSQHSIVEDHWRKVLPQIFLARADVLFASQYNLKDGQILTLDLLAQNMPHELVSQGYQNLFGSLPVYLNHELMSPLSLLVDSLLLPYETTETIRRYSIIFLGKALEDNSSSTTLNDLIASAVLGGMLCFDIKDRVRRLLMACVNISHQITKPRSKVLQIATALALWGQGIGIDKIDASPIKYNHYISFDFLETYLYEWVHVKGFTPHFWKGIKQESRAQFVEKVRKYAHCLYEYLDEISSDDPRDKTNMGQALFEGGLILLASLIFDEKLESLVKTSTGVYYPSFEQYFMERVAPHLEPVKLRLISAK